MENAVIQASTKHPCIIRIATTATTTGLCS
jgi:hypothetical protein